MAAQMPVMVPGSPNYDFKTQLNTFCQRYTKKVIGKADIVYETVQFGEQYQSTLSLPCLGGAQYAGEAAATQKEAEQVAARIALENYSAEIANLPPPVLKNRSNNKKKKAPTGIDFAAAASNPLMNNRVLLNTALMKILNRSMTKEDYSKTTVQTEFGYQCTLSIPALPGHWAALAWAGEAAENEKAAEESAAVFALQALQADPTFVQLMTGPPPPAKKQRIGGMSPQQPFATGGELSGESQFGGCWPGFLGKGKGFGKGCKGGWNAEPKVRQPIPDTAMLGQVLEWKGTYGWIQPSQPVDHPSATKNGGRIYLSISDWQAGAAQPPQVGQNAQFTLYSDQSGLGAENTMGF